MSDFTRPKVSLIQVRNLDTYITIFTIFQHQCPKKISANITKVALGANVNLHLPLQDGAGVGAGGH